MNKFRLNLLKEKSEDAGRKDTKLPKRPDYNNLKLKGPTLSEHEEKLFQSQKQLKHFKDEVERGRFSTNLFCQAWPAFKIRKESAPNNEDLRNLFSPLERRIITGRFSRRTMNEFIGALECIDGRSMIQRTKRLKGLCSISESNEMTDEEYKILLKSFACDYVLLDMIQKDVTSTDEFLKAYKLLAELSRMVRGEEISRNTSEYDDSNINIYLKNIHNAVISSRVGAALTAGGGVVHHQLRKSVIPNDIDYLISGCGYAKSEEIIVSTIAAGKYQWPSYTPEETFNKVIDCFNIDTKNLRRIRSPGLAKLLTGEAVIAGNFYIIDAITRSNNHENTFEIKATSAVVCTGLGLYFIWLGLNDLLGTKF